MRSSKPASLAGLAPMLMPWPQPQVRWPLAVSARLNGRVAKSGARKAGMTITEVLLPGRHLTGGRRSCAASKRAAAGTSRSNFGQEGRRALEDRLMAGATEQ